MIAFRNPANGYQESANHPGFWCLLFGCFYFAAKGIWSHAIIGLVAAVVTSGASWLIYPFFARSIVRTHYQRRGWIEVSVLPPGPRAPARTWWERSPTGTVLAIVLWSILIGLFIGLA